MLSALKAYRLFVEKAEEESGMKSFKRNFMAVLIPVIVLLAALACQRSQTTPVTTGQAGDQLHTISVNGLERTYLLHMPRGLDLGQPSPLVLVFHGYSGNAEAARLISGFNRIAGEEHFIVVYPNGMGDDASTLSWNGGRCCFYARGNDIDDIGFTRQMIADIESYASIDPKHIYAAGISNGGIFSYRLACEMSATFAAVAPVAGSLVYEPCQPEQPISVIHVHGLDDNVVPYNGTGALPELSDVGFTPVEEGITFWAEQNGCPAETQVEQNGAITHTVYAPCRNDTAVELYAVAGTGHTWPLLKIQTSRVIWDFFTAHPKP
jgi:polyhydroxybutyrate depolymerase